MKRFLPLPLLIAGLVNSFAFAEKAPLSRDQLATQADAIVVATIGQIRIDTEPSQFEPGWGNSDWGIYLTLGIETVEKGSVPDEELEVRCFRIRSRRSSAEYLTPSGHHPIPSIGTRVRVYLRSSRSSWSVILPNGITSVHDTGDWPGRELADAIEVTQLRSRAYTYFLPVETWTLLFLLGVPSLLALAVLVHRLRRQLRKRTSRVTTDQPTAAEP